MQEELRSPKVLTLETESGDVMKNAHIWVMNSIRDTTEESMKGGQKNIIERSS